MGKTETVKGGLLKLVGDAARQHVVAQARSRSGAVISAPEGTEGFERHGVEGGEVCLECLGSRMGGLAPHRTNSHYREQAGRLCDPQI